jgi:hypothetical protein
MKKGFVLAAVCALALAAPATAERTYVPVLGTTAADGSALATEVWVANADGVERPATAKTAGLIAIDAESALDVSAWMVGPGEKGLAEVPVFTDAEVYQAGTNVPLADLPRPRAMASLFVGAANLSEQTAFCSAKLYGRGERLLAEIPFEVAPLSLAREEALQQVGRGRVAEVYVTCDQSFYPVAVASDASGRRVVFAKGIGPNGPCNYTLTLVKQAATGHYTAASPQGIFHDATRANPKGIICLKVPQDLRIAKARFEWDVTVGPWSQRNRAGIHNLAYFFLDRYRSGVVGNVNAAGPNKSILKVMQNVGLSRGSNTNAKSNYELQQNLTYHFIYTYDAANKQALLQTFLGSVVVNQFTLEARPGGQTLVLRPYAKAESQGGLAMVAEFGNYNNQHAPEMPTWLWKYANFKVDMTPK